MGCFILIEIRLQKYDKTGVLERSRWNQFEEHIEIASWI